MRQADKIGKPWGVPSGRVLEQDGDIKDVALRELREETGLRVAKEDLMHLGFVLPRPERQKGHLLYIVKVGKECFDLSHVEMIEDGTIKFPPPFDVKEMR